jgi:hypothetical protein
MKLDLFVTGGLYYWCVAATVGLDHGKKMTWGRLPGHRHLTATKDGLPRLSSSLNNTTIASSSASSEATVHVVEAAEDCGSEEVSASARTTAFELGVKHGEYVGDFIVVGLLVVGISPAVIWGSIILCVSLGRAVLTKRNISKC